MSDHKTKKHLDFDPERRRFISRDLPGTALIGYIANSGIAVALLNFICAVLGQNVFASESLQYPGYHEQQRRLTQNDEWQERIELEKSRLANGIVCPRQIHVDRDIEYKLIGSLKRYDWEPTNEAFFKIFREVINRLSEAPKCYGILTEFNRKNSHITHEICYHPYYVDLTYFMCGKTVHQMHIARTFMDTSKKSLIGTMYHELIAHGSQVVELTNRGKSAGEGRTRIMKQWERELEGNLIKWYAAKEMYGFREVKNVQEEMKRWLGVFPEWNYFRIKEIEKLEVENVVRHLLTHYQNKYRNDSWVSTTYLHKLVS